MPRDVLGIHRLYQQNIVTIDIYGPKITRGHWDSACDKKAYEPKAILENYLGRSGFSFWTSSRSIRRQD